MNWELFGIFFCPLSFYIDSNFRTIFWYSWSLVSVMCVNDFWSFFHSCVLDLRVWSYCVPDKEFLTFLSAFLPILLFSYLCAIFVFEWLVEILLRVNSMLLFWEHVHSLLDTHTISVSTWLFKFYNLVKFSSVGIVSYSCEYSPSDYSSMSIFSVWIYCLLLLRKANSVLLYIWVLSLLLVSRAHSWVEVNCSETLIGVFFSKFRFQLGVVLPWSKGVHIVIDDGVSREDKMKILDFFRHIDIKRSPRRGENLFGFVMNFSDFLRTIELGKRQKRKKSVATQVLYDDFAEPNFSGLFD